MGLVSPPRSTAMPPRRRPPPKTQPRRWQQQRQRRRPPKRVPTAAAASFSTTRRMTTRMAVVAVGMTLLVGFPPTTKVAFVGAVLQQHEISVYVSSSPSSSSSTGPVVQNPTYTLLASPAFFGSYPSMDVDRNPIEALTLPPSDNPLLCNKPNGTETETAKNVFGGKSSTSQNQKDATASDGNNGNGGNGISMLVPRGGCTFQRKAYHAQLSGATSMILYGTLASRYALNETNKTADYRYTKRDVVWPYPKQDYDCANGRAFVPSSRLDLEHPLPYNATQNDPILSGNGTSGDGSMTNLCMAGDKHRLDHCPSKACLLTGEMSLSKDHYEACCAWDLHIWLYADDTFYDTSNTSDRDDLPVVTIPSVYVTVEQGNRLLRDLRGQNQNSAGGGGGGSKVRVVISERWRASYNASSYLIWALGVAVAAVASYLSADEYHAMTRRVLKHRRRSNDDDRGDRGRRRDANNQQSRSSRNGPSQEEQMELTAYHAIGFIVMASTSLLVLFYFKIYKFVKVLYALGCSKAVSQVVFDPLVRWCMKRIQYKNKVLWRTGTEDFGDITVRDLVSHLAGYAVGVAWLVLAFTVRHPENSTFFWVTQDVFGAAMCITFLQVIKLNSLNVAAILLIVAFLYDIFFVFVSPLLFQKSVMITVATSGGPPKADALWCEKYPDDPDCQGGDPLPMLFTIPRIHDYTGGSSLLGLGDIVLPGLLLSFAARFDAAKALLGVLSGGHGSVRQSPSCPPERRSLGGYFPPLVAAYGVGLFMANAAVYLMEMGQPALLYLVPCCLGTMGYMGYKRGELKDIWDGPKAIRAADDIIYGEEENSRRPPGGGGTTAHAPLPTSEHDALNGAAVAPSAVDDDEDDNASGGVALMREKSNKR